METRTRAWRRQQDKKAIEKRRKIVKDCWHARDYLNSVPKGAFRKWNFTCDCRMCKMDRYYGSLEKHRRQLAKSVQEPDYY